MGQTAELFEARATLLALNTRRGRGVCWGSEIGTRTRDKLHLVTRTCIQLTMSWLVHFLGARMSHGRLWTHKTDYGSNSREATTFPHIEYSAPHPNGFLSRDSQEGVSKLQHLVLWWLWGHITFCADLRSQWGLKKSCSPHRELSNSVSHIAWTQGNWVNSQLLVVGSQIVNLTPGPSFTHNLCCRCPNGSCKTIFDIYASRPFQQHKEHLKVRCFDPCNRVLNFWESRRTPKSPFRECECHPHTPSEWGCYKIRMSN